MNITEEQAQRYTNLEPLVETHHRGKFRDYDDTYEEFHAAYLAVHEAAADGEPFEGEPVPIPRYAAVRTDETYGMIDLCETLVEAIAAEGSSVGEEYLMNPSGVFDLDTGERVATTTVSLSEEAYIVLCGLVQPDWLTCGADLEPEAVNRGGIYSEAWDELRATFPLDTFRKAAQERGEDFYHEEAGL